MNKVEAISEKELEIAKADAARAYLSDVRKLAYKKKCAEVEYELAIERASGLTGIDYSRDVVSTSPSADAIPNAVERYTELKDNIDALSKVADEAINECDELLNRLQSENGMVLRMRHRGSKVSDIAFSLGYVDREIYRKQKAGLIELYDAGIPHQYRINYQKAV